MIRTIEELSAAVGEEANKLGIDPTSIDIDLYENYRFIVSRGAVSKRNDRYRLTVYKNFFGSTTRRLIRHELAHVANEDLEHGSLLRYMFVEEPRAALYGTFGIRL